MSVSQYPIEETGADLFVVLRVPYPDGSGGVKVLGVYTDRESAEARGFREVKNTHYEGYNIIIVERPLDLDNENDNWDCYNDEDEDDWSR